MSLPSTSMNVFETILARRSVRSYSPTEVGRETVQTLLEAAVRAPTALHEELWSFVIVQDRQLLRRLSELAKPLFVAESRRAGLEGAGHGPDAFADPDFNIFYDAGTLIVICADPAAPLAAADCWLAAENLMLAACAMGLGTCVIGSCLPALGLPEVKRMLNIPDGAIAVAPIVVGHLCGETVRTSRREPRVLAWQRAVTQH
jgi:nitroreductase